MAYPVQGDPTKVFGRRVLAALIDGLLIIVPAIVLVTSQLEYLDTAGLGVDPQVFCDRFIEDPGGVCLNADDIDGRVYFSEGVPGAGTAFFWIANPLLLVLLQGLAGWTPGKLVTGIRTVGEDGRAPGIGRAAVRWLLWIADGFPYFLPLVGFIVGLTTVGHRRVGDMVAKTFVVRASAMGSPIVVPGLTAPPAPMGAPGAWGTPPPPGAAPGTSWGQPAPPAPPPTDRPQWDEARGTYIQWDPVAQAWMQWDEGTRAWSRIPGQ